jgi:hypothetical protein
LCVGIARAIFFNTRAYATSWDGWTHPDPDYYVKLAGYPLRNEGPPVGKCDPVAAKLVKDFRCPLDNSPRLNRHGYYSSHWYLLPGCRLTDIQNPEKTPVVVGVYRRHQSPGSEPDDRTSFHVVFADGHWILAKPGDIDAPQACVPGVACFAWYTTTPATLFDALKTMPDIDLQNAALQAAKRVRSSAQAAGCLSYDSDDWAWIADDWRDPDGNRRVIASEGHDVPANCVIRWEGYWKFPQDGTDPKSAVRLLGDWFDPRRGWLWLDLNDNNVIEPKETLSDQTITLEANRKYRLVVLWYNGISSVCRTRVLWHYDRLGESGNWKSLSYAECFHEPGATYLPP